MATTDASRDDELARQLQDPFHKSSNIALGQSFGETGDQDVREDARGDHRAGSAS